MKLRVGATTYTGRVVDLRTRSVDGAAVAAAVRGERRLPAIDCPTPSPVYDYAGYVHPKMGLQTRTALAAAARSLDYETPHDDAIADRRSAIAALDLSPPTLAETPEPVPETTIAGLRETVAEHRGRVRARCELGRDGDEARADLRDAAAQLSERETQQAAAKQTRVRRRETARAYRDRLEKRRRLADELANLEREARATLVDRLAGTFGAAVRAVPGPTPADPFDAPPVTAALAVLRVARTDAPVVLSVDRFDSPTAAAEFLGTPVVRC